ncbi:MAG: class I SAM-dependent methyltransferase [Akkermansiaceae bacterium]
MKSRYLILIPIILLALMIIPLILVRNELIGKKPEVIKPSRATVEQMEETISPPTEAAQPNDPDPAPPAEETLPPTAPPTYTYATPSPDGIGKIFMGREISHVMGHPGIGWLERDDREKEEAPSKAIALLELAPDTIIADIGAGSGYYSFRIAPLVPKGQVVALDIQKQMLRVLRDEAEKQGISNVVPRLSSVESVELPENSIDAALMVDAYHEFSHPAEMLKSLHKALKPGGKIYLLEYRAEDPEVPIKRLHKMSAAQAKKEFQALNFNFLENKPDLPWQHLLIFEKPH